MAGDLLPYFKVFPAETLADERFDGWTFEERGLWLTLLLKIWVNGSIPADIVELARVLHADATALRPLWDRIADRFMPHPDLPEGRLTSRRLEVEREDAQAKSRAGEKAAKSRWNKKNLPDATALRPHCNRNAVAMRPPMPAAQRSAAHHSAAAEQSHQPAAGSTETGKDGLAAPPAPPQDVRLVTATGPDAAEEPVRRLEVEDEAGERTAGPPRWLRACSFRLALSNAMARGGLYPVGGREGEVWPSLEASLAEVPEDEAVELCRSRILDAIHEKKRQPGSLAYFAQVLADEALRRRETASTPPPPPAEEPRAGVVYEV